MKNFLIVTGTRAEYGLLKNLIKDLKLKPNINVKLVVTGTHLSSNYGNTAEEICNDNVPIDHCLNMLLDYKNKSGTIKSSALLMLGIAELFQLYEPDLLITLGDRYEMHAVCTAAMLANIPIAHIHGGELTQGAIDDAIRHSITKMSHIHFAVAEDYKRRIIQMGELPCSVYNVGGLGVDSILKSKIIAKSDLENDIGFKFDDKSLLVTHHPTTLETSSYNIQEINNILSALDHFSDVNILFTATNADTHGSLVYEKILSFCSKRTNCQIIPSLGQTRYFSCLKYVSGVLGNSSSGLLEVPYFKKTTINIGKRQEGRIRTPSIIDCSPTQKEIISAIKTLFTDAQIQRVQGMSDLPYGYGGATQKIIDVLMNIDYTGILEKRFYDLH